MHVVDCRAEDLMARITVEMAVSAALLLALSGSALAETISGTVTNKTTNKPAVALKFDLAFCKAKVYCTLG